MGAGEASAFEKRQVGEVAAVVASVTCQKAIGLRLGVAADEEVAKDVLAGRDWRLAGRTTDFLPLTAPGALETRPPAPGVHDPGSGSQEERFRSRGEDPNARIGQECVQLGLGRELGRELGVDDFPDDKAAPALRHLQETQ